MNVYLKPFTYELKKLSRKVDSIARPQVQNKTQHNGRCGCSYCDHEGETVSVVGNLRSHEEYMKDAKLAIESDEIIRGIKGPSIVSKIPNFDMIHGFPPDYMHSCLLGVVKLFGTEWFDSKNSDKEWYMGLKINEFNNKFLAIKPPTEITRVPRSVTESKIKASEWKRIHEIQCTYSFTSSNVCQEVWRSLGLRCIEYGRHLRVFGIPNKFKLPLNTRLIIEQLLQQEIENDSDIYERFIYNNSLFHTTKYLRLKKRNNSTILTYDNQLILITDLVAVRELQTNHEKYVLLGTKLMPLNEEICRNDNISTNLFSIIVKKTNEVVSINVSSIMKKCIMVALENDKWYVVPLVNNLETD
ncbi:hypothetical protein TSAR_010800 [Trichomalopsis sarcophagae]|uniref:Uncharacterized protein n=1 Tax=Trichomalopsis sarcophagae TaxID=543379 RepID=A0A232EUA6_9HYME|nr:hypothetical protein TSAR_010800 [Trichomalopsis sarcophagae]